MNELKFCRNCANYYPKTAVDCRAPENSTISLVTGEQIVADQAVVSRGMDTIGCGRTGKWFKQKTEEVAA